MSDKPVPFSAPMVRALLREIDQPGTGKTQTRRVLKPQPPTWANFCEQPQMLNVFHRWVPSGLWRWAEIDERRERQVREWPLDEDGSHYWFRPPFAVGDRLYVREAWKTHAAYDDISPAEMGGDEPVLYMADGAHQTWGYPAITKIGRFRQGMFMPRWASRITLIVTDVRVQRLQEISDDDAIAEGVTLDGATAGVDFDIDGQWWPGGPTRQFRSLWDSLNDKPARPGCAWRDNPWVAAYTFRPIIGNIDQIGGDA